MYTTQKHTIEAAQQVLLTYANTLLTYAAQDAEFAAHFKDAITKQNWQSVPVTDSGNCSIYVYPHSQADAVSTARWVIQSLQTHPEYTITRGRLAQWAQHYESPKDLVLGIVGLAIIGPTLGLINSRKKKKRKSQLILEQTYFQSLSTSQLATQCTTLTQSVIAQETRLAGGNVYNLHPDSAAWCIEEAITALYTDSSKNLQSLFWTAQAEHLSHQVQKTAEGVLQAIVIAPSVNDSLVEESDAQKI